MKLFAEWQFFKSPLAPLFQREIEGIPLGIHRDGVMYFIRRAFIFLIFMSLPAVVFPAEKAGPLTRVKEAINPAEQAKIQEDPLGRTSPQGTVIGFLKSATQGDYERALQYLDTKKKGLSAQELIVALRGILERGFSGNLAMLSNKPEGYLDDNLPASKDRVVTLNTALGSIDILL